MDQNSPERLAVERQVECRRKNEKPLTAAKERKFRTYGARGQVASARVIALAVAETPAPRT